MPQIIHLQKATCLKYALLYICIKREVYENSCIIFTHKS